MSKSSLEKRSALKAGSTLLVTRAPYRNWAEAAITDLREYIEPVFQCVASLDLPMSAMSYWLPLQWLKGQDLRLLLES